MGYSRYEPLEIDRNELDLKLKPNEFKYLSGIYAYALSTSIFFCGYLDIFVQSVGFMVYLFSIYVVRSTPKMIVLRSFDNEKIDLFLRSAVAAFGLKVRPIWLRDAGYKPFVVRPHLPTPSLYATRIFVIFVMGFSIIGTKPGNLPYEIVWVAWIMFGTSVLHRYQAGRSATYFLSMILSLLFMMFFRDKLREYLFYNPTSTWWDAAQITLWFMIIFAIFCTIMGSFSAIRWVFSKFYFRNVIRTENDLMRFFMEIDEKKYLFKRFIPTASASVIEIQSYNRFWEAVVVYSINRTSILFVDITGIRPTSSLAWELSQARHANIAIFFTCKSDALEDAKSVISLIGYNDVDVFTWNDKSYDRYDNPKIDIDIDKLVAMFYSHTENRYKAAKNKIDKSKSKKTNNK